MNTQDREERDAVIADYLAMKKRLQECNLQERSDMIVLQRDLEENFKLVLVMAEEIIKDLVPLKDGFKGIIENIEKAGKKRKLVGEDCGPLAK